VLLAPELTRERYPKETETFATAILFDETASVPQALPLAALSIS
jgi:hypothetical protein